MLINFFSFERNLISFASVKKKIKSPPGFFLQKTFLVLTLMSALQTWLMKNGRIIRARISWRVALTVLHCFISWRQVVLNNINVAVLCDGLSRWWGRITCYSEPVFEPVSLLIKHMKWRSFYLWGATFAHGSVAKWGALSQPGPFLDSTWDVSKAQFDIFAINGYNTLTVLTATDSNGPN